MPGYSNVALEGCNEKASVHLSKHSTQGYSIKAVDAGENPTVQEYHPAPYDETANGGIESAVKAITGMYRTPKLRLDRGLCMKVPVKHTILQRLAEYSALQIAIINV